MDCVDDIPSERCAAAAHVLRAMRRGQAFFAPYGSAAFLAVIDLMRFGLVEFAGGSPHRIGVRLKKPSIEPRRPGRRRYRRLRPERRRCRRTTKRK